MSNPGDCMNVKAVWKFPPLLMRIAENRLMLSTVMMLAANLTVADTLAFLERASNVVDRHKQPHQLSQTEYQELVKENIRKLKPTYVTGKVVDTLGHPLSGVEVELIWYKHTLDPNEYWKQYKEIITTGISGKYEFICDKARHGTVTAKKDGFAYVYRSGADTVIGGYSYIKDAGILVLRKCETKTLVLGKTDMAATDRMFVFYETDKASKTTDMFSMLAGRNEHSSTNKDLMVSAVFDKKTKSWQVIFSVTHETDGFCTKTNLLYVAPDEKYSQQYCFNATNTRSESIYFYLRTGNPAVYSRLHVDYKIKHTNKYETCLNLNYAITVNPYGERTFEYDERVDQFWREKPQWVEDAKAALRERRYPGKIDIDALIKAEKETGKK
jgi:hypothetical protein